MTVPVYVRRIAGLLDVFDRLEDYPEGVSLDVLAGDCGLNPEQLREDLLAYYAADPGWWLGLERRHVLEWTSPETSGEDVDPHQAVAVRLVGDPSDLGVDYLDAGELALVYTAATAALEMAGPAGDPDLASALDVIVDTMYGDVAPSPQSGWRSPYLDDLKRAASEHRLVRLVYSRQWGNGIFERVIEPWRLVQTTVRGWEIDAGPVATNGKLRSYLLSNVRGIEVLDETFSLPNDAQDRLAEQRQTFLVTLELPHRSRWALDEYAEEVTILEDADESVVVQAALLEPVGWRVGLLMLAGGVDTRVIEPAGLISEGPALAARLLAHHAARG
jgi:predicted DNA-binding transcriptional regulator YafY